MKLAVAIEYCREKDSFTISNIGEFKVPIFKDGRILSSQSIVRDISLNDLAENLKLSEYNRCNNEIIIDDNKLFIDISDDLTPSKYDVDTVLYEISYSQYNKEQCWYFIVTKEASVKVVRDGVIEEYHVDCGTGFEIHNFDDFVRTLEENKVFRDCNKIKIIDGTMCIM
ncbi:MAG: hypothetical protein J6A59_02150 [Lachnospiraceae bacterium]|nr:hypothetical protein [Lachnospiraceae bacterium]